MCSSSSRKLCNSEGCKNCFKKSFASHEKSKFWSDKNCNIKPINVFKCSGNKYWFNCDKCNHEFNSSLHSISKYNWCCYCCDPPKQLCEKENCQSCYEKSFASHEKSKYWSKKNEINPRKVFKSSNKKYWFDCNCGHDFESALCTTTGNNTWCCYCCNPSKQLCENEKCQMCFEKSFASHEKSKYWSKKNEIDPRKVFKSSNKKYWFNCNCGHEFKSCLDSITLNNTWCYYCCNPSKQLCENEKCQMCFEKSFASHEKSKYWSKKNEINPRKAFKSSHTKYWFTCIYGHEFNSCLNNITENNSWCILCINKTEKKLYEKLIQLYPNIISQFRVDWCKNIITSRFLPFDFVLKEQKIIIELDGPQHFVQISNWRTPEEQYESDQYKEKCANENGFSVIRVIQEDVWNDKYKWLNELTQNINELTSKNIKQNIYMCKNNEYVKNKNNLQKYIK